MLKLIFPKVASSGLMNYYREDVFWQSVDSLKDYETTKREYADKEDKPWGYEKTLVSNEKYLAKKLYLMKGEGTAYHKHLKKDETMYVMAGSIVVTFKDKKVYLNKDEKIRIRAGIEYCIDALENTILQEYSTPFPEDTIRIKDRYKRA